jgi:putative permease
MFASIVIAYLLEAVVARLQKIGMPRLPAVIVVFLLFITLLLFLFFGLVPLVSRQLTQLVQQFPAYITTGQELLRQLPEAYPELISAAQIEELIKQLGRRWPASGSRCSAGRSPRWGASSGWWSTWCWFRCWSFFS